MNEFFIYQQYKITILLKLLKKASKILSLKSIKLV